MNTKTSSKSITAPFAGVVPRIITKEIMLYKFARRTNNLPDDIDRARTFENEQIIEALQEASNYWFRGRKVDTWLKDKNDVITLLSGWGSGNVIGTLMDNTKYLSEDEEA